MENGLPRIDEEKCVGCGVCVDVCPKGLLVLMPRSQKTYVACSSRDSGAATMKSCKVGCIGCRKCEKACPTGAIKVENNLASIDPEKCENCGECVKVCPTHAIHALYPVEIKKTG
jgi:ferredoxin